MIVQYVLIDNNKRTRSEKCTSCSRVIAGETPTFIAGSTVWFSFGGTDDLCGECFNTIRHLSIIPENNPNRPMDSSILNPALEPKT